MTVRNESPLNPNGQEFFYTFSTVFANRAEKYSS